MGQVVRSWWERAGLNAGLGWVVLVAAIALVVNYSGLLKDSEQQKELVSAVAALEQAMSAEIEARKLLGLGMQNLADRGAERTARRDADIASLGARLSAAESKIATIQVEIAAKLGELLADVRAIKEKLANTRAAATVPSGAG